MQNFATVLDRHLSVKNAPKLYAKYLEDKISKTKQIQNVPVTLGIYINQVNMFLEKLNPKETPLKIQCLKF